MFFISDYFKIVLFIVLLINSGLVRAQQSPGNVSTDLGLWLKGDSYATIPNPNHITSNWDDESGNNNDAIYGPASTVWYEASKNINFNYSLFFNDDWFDSPLDINVAEVNVFIVYKLQANGGGVPLWGNGSNSSLLNYGKRVYNNQISIGATASPNPYSNTSNANEIYINHVSYKDGISASVYSNGNSISNYNPSGLSTIHPDLHGGVFIGKETESTIPSNNLNIAEFIAYTGEITPAKRDRINSYLAIKYGVTLPHDYSINNGNTIVWDVTANTGYNENIAGIARDDDSDLDQDQSKSENGGAILTLSAAGNIGNQEALLIGDNGAATNTFSAFQSSDNFFVKGKRIDKAWKCQKTAGFTSKIDLKIDNGITLPTEFKPGNFVLLVADDASFITNLTAYPIVNGATAYEIDDVDLSDGQYFTLAYCDVALWAKASEGVVNQWGNIDELDDNVLGINTLISPGGQRPTYDSVNSLINFHPYVKFNQGNTGKYLSASNFVGFGNSGTSTFMVVRRDNSNAPGTEALLSYATATQDNEMLLENLSNLTMIIGGGTGSSSAKSITDGIPHIVTNIRGNNSDNNTRLDGNGNSGPYRNNTAVEEGGTFVLGQEQDSPGAGFTTGQEYEGDFVEIIVFNKRVSNGNERDAIEAYLAVKYGITLGQDYKLSDNAVTWNKNVNTAYHQNVAGIGRDDLFSLDQRKTTSQNGTGVDVTIEHASPFPNNLSHLIWGCNMGTYNNITPANAPTGYQTSEKIWKVQNLNNRVDEVTVTLKIPASMASNVANLKLLVNNSATFSTAAISYPNTTSGTSTSTATFTNVTLKDGDFFTLALLEDPIFLNNDPGSPLTYEACAGSQVTFRYSGLTSMPNEIQLRDKMGAPLVLSGADIVVNNTANTPNVGINEGTIDLTIPDNAGISDVKILANSTILHAFAGLLVIHSPNVDFFAQQSLICATDTVSMIGVPAGGIFTASGYLNLFDNNSLLGGNAEWSMTNDPAKNISVTYGYRDSYNGGAVCFYPVEQTKSIEIKDNRLKELIMRPIVTETTVPTVNDRVDLELTTSIIRSLEPDLFNMSIPTSFLGTYINQGTPDTFLTDYAGFGKYPITLEYNNGGCIGSINSEIEVLPPPIITGLADTLCSMADPITLGRDVVNYPNQSYVRTFDYHDNNGALVQVQKFYEYNKRISFRAKNLANQGSLTSTASNPTNDGPHLFDPEHSSLNNASFVVFESKYETTITTIVSGSTTTTTSKSDTITVLDTMYLQAKPVFSLALDPFYCENSLRDTLRPIPNLNHNASNSFSLKIADAMNNFTIPDVLIQDTIFDPVHYYNNHTPNNNGTVKVRLVYKANYYGCLDSITRQRNIKQAPTATIGTGLDDNYCINGTDGTLIGNPLSSSGISGIYSGPGINTSTGVFTPSSAGGIGQKILSYTFTANNGCKGVAFDTTNIRALPVPLITSPANNSIFLTTAPSVPLMGNISGGVFSNAIAGAVTPNSSNNYFFNPVTGAGIYTVTYDVTNTYGCQDSVHHNYIVNDASGTVTYVNNSSPFASATFEACPGDTVTFAYNSLTGEPDQIEFVDTSGGSLIVNITVASLPTSGQLHSGTIRLKIPSDAATGKFNLLNSSVNPNNNGYVLHSSSMNLIIHNPSLELLIPQALICAMDTISVIGIPSGGTMSAANFPTLFNNDQLIGLNANWSTQNDSIKSIDIEYEYSPSYFNGTSCPQPISIIKNVEIRDNRLDQLDFISIVSDSLIPTDKDRVALNLNTLTVSPHFDSSYNYPITFSGTYVNPIPSDTFLTDYAGFGEHPIHVEYNNGGCIGAITSDLNVLSPLRLLELPDNLCKDADPVNFYRDTVSQYAYIRDTLVENLISGHVITTYIENNKVDSVVTQNPAHQVAIQVVSNPPASDFYRFIPANLGALLPIPNKVTVEMHYTSTSIIEEKDGNGQVVSLDTIMESFNGSQVVNIKERPIINFTIDSFFCKDAAAHTLTPFPLFDDPQTTYFQVKGNVTTLGTYDSLTRLQNVVFDPGQIYDQYAASVNRDLSVQLIYHVNQYGCSDSDTIYTKIIEPVATSFTVQNPTSYYCTDDLPRKLIVAPIAVAGTGVFLVGDSLNSSSITTDTTGAHFFSPGIAREGIHKVTYQFTDTLGCKNISANEFFNVKIPPQIRLEVDGQSTSPVALCANDTSILLKTIVLSNGGVQTIAYSSLNNQLDIVGDTLNPKGSLGPNQTSLIDVIRVNFTDNFGCSVRDFLTVDISKPVVDIAGFSNSSSSFDGRYCNNEAEFIITASPSSSTGIFSSLVGGGVSVNSSGVHHYDPHFTSVDSFLIDRIRYTFMDSSGCSNTIEKIVQIDSIPVVDLLYLDSSYCINNSSVQLQGIPSGASTAGTPIYSGLGLNPNSGEFTPSIAGVGPKSLGYTFIDNNGCENTILDTTIVHALPILHFTGYDPQYCTLGALDTLFSGNDLLATNSSYRFWGNIIDSVGILTPSLALTQGIGTQTIFYAYVDSLGCTDTSQVSVTVNPTPEIIVNGLDSSYCYNGLNDNISVSPAGGTFHNSHPAFSLNGNTISFIPSYDTTAGAREFTYIYENSSTGCTDTLTGETFVYKMSLPTYSGIDSLYCEVDNEYPITGIPIGGVFSGPGVFFNGANSQYYFNPKQAGDGVYTIDYEIDSVIIRSLDTLICQVEINIPVEVKPLPNPIIIGPSDNSDFCSNDPRVLLEGGGLTGTWDLFTSLAGGIDTTIQDTLVLVSGTLYNLISDTSYYFDPNLAGSGINYITYIATDSISGCQDSVIRTYHVTNYVEPVILDLDSTYCESDDIVFLDGNPDGIKVFVLNSDTLASPHYTPNPNYGVSNLTTTIVDTIIFSVENGACNASDTQYVEVKPVPIVSFVGMTGVDTYCIKDDTTSILLVPNIQGGSFQGEGLVSRDSSVYFYPHFAKPGNHAITYQYIDALTGCDNKYTDTLRVLSMPNIEFDVVGGCELDSVLFYPDNDLLGINNSLYDSITSVKWEFEPNVIVNGHSNSNNQIDTISHVFSGPGVYWTKLYVANQNYCLDTATVRLVISPEISSFPYDETFESSYGNWYAEAKNSDHSLLWEWGIDSVNGGINNNGNRIWTTNLNALHEENEAAWVYSPCFDISNLTRPMVRLDYWSDAHLGTNGTVLEYQKSDGTWSPLGKLGRGINWFNTSIIAGSPGNQVTAPIGWSGKTSGWVNGRYKLDEFQANGKLRLRMAFGSISTSLGSGYQYDGFAFDNVWIGNRTRNVLLETTSNISEPNMGVINDYVYQLIFHTSINKDLVLLQYHPKYPTENDVFYKQNKKIGTSRAFYYSGNAAASGKSFIDGFPNGIFDSRYLQAIDFEQDMLRSPKFKIKIDTTQTQTQNNIQTRAVITAMENMPLGKYNVNVVISEDSLTYPNGNVVHAVVRESNQNPNDSSYIFNRSWTAGDSIEVVFDWNHNANPNYNPANFQAVVFIELHRGEVYQAATSRNISGYWVGVNKVEAEPELQEIISMNLYPNPARDYIKVAFENELQTDYQWKLVSLNGVEVKSGLIEEGEELLEINSSDLPTGLYIFAVLNDKVFSQKKVIISRD